MKNIKPYLIFFYVWVLLEGILRKWIAPSISNALFLGKLVFSIYFTLQLIQLNRKKILADNNVILALTGYMIYLFITFFIGALNYGPIIPLLGLTVHIAYFPLFFMIPLVLKSKNDLLKVLKYFNYIVLLIFILGIYQYTLPSDHFLNKYVNDIGYVAQVGDAVRITTIFPYVGLSQYFIVFAALISFIQFVLKIGKVHIVAVNIILGAVCVFMTGARFALGFYFVAFIAFLLLAKPFNVVNSKQFFRIIIILPVLAIFASQTSFFQAAVSNFESRISNADNSEDRLIDVFTPFKFSENAGFFGHGLGVTANPSQAFIHNRSNLPSYWEEESERIVIEQGMLGFIVLVLFRLTILVYLFKVMRREKDKQLKGLLLFFFIYQVPAVLVMPQTNFVYIENIIYCTQIGVLFFIADYQKKRLRYESNSC